MNIAIRTDASVQIGTGHVMRCLALADRMKMRRFKVCFICRDLPGNLNSLIASKGYSLITLSEPKEVNAPIPSEEINPYAHWLRVPQELDASQTAMALQQMGHLVDWVVVDHYAIDTHWETYIQRFCKNIMVIDDLANRSHNCNLILDQNLCKDFELRYQKLVPEYCKTLVGPTYALLRPEFEQAYKKAVPRTRGIKRIFVFFGGIDASNETMKALRGIEFTGKNDFSCDIVVGAKNPHLLQIQEYCARRNHFRLHVQTDRISDLMAAADIALGAGGSATWERCFLGLPCITILLSENQYASATTLHNMGVICLLGKCSSVKTEDITSILLEFFSNDCLLSDMSNKAFQLFSSDYQGAEGVVGIMTAMLQLPLSISKNAL